MHGWLLETWYGDTGRGGWLLPLAWLFSAAAAARRAAYRRGWLNAYRSRRPVVVIGNVTVGGTGKTPLVLWLAERLAGEGAAVGIASRGYGGRAAAPRIVTANDHPAEVGDEPVLLARRGVARVAVGADRAAAVRLLEGECDIVLCDDGLQHHALARDAEVVVIDGARGFGNGRLLPAGPLREPRSRVADAAAVVVNGPGTPWPGALHMHLRAVRFVNLGSGEARPPEAFRGQDVRAVAAIGNPDRFFGLLGSLGARVEPHPLPDHADPTPLLRALGPGAPILMTEKDAVKCGAGAGVHCWYLEVAADPGPEGAARLMAVVKAARSAVK